MITKEEERSGELLTLESFTNSEIDEILTDGDKFAQGSKWRVDKDVFVANLFYEPSTRTRFSFEIAEKSLGLHVLSFSEQGSSSEKGETLLDTAKTFEALGAELLVIRHPEDNFYAQLRNQLSIPIINAGDGSGQHPTQSLLDLLTMKQEFQTFQGLNVVITGDLRHSRVARSNAKVLKQLGANVLIAGPEEWLAGYPYEHVQLDDVIGEIDVLMLLRIQHERHDGNMPWTTAEYHEKFGLTIEREKKMNNRSIILHPGPVNRGVELADELVDCERSRIFKQMQNGVAIRKAVIKRTIERGGI